MENIDLRSDTVTHPTKAMKEAVFNAELGDDVFSDDPTTIRFEKHAAALVGKEAALLVPSGTMGNLVCMLTHCPRGVEVILGDKAHQFLHEVGGMAALGGIHPHTIPNQPDGTLRLEDIEAAIRGDNEHWPRTRLVCLENTHNTCGGFPLTPEYTDSVAELAKRHGLSLHLDGSRIFNSAVAQGVDVKELTRSVDSLTFCLSKGLSAPIGSVVCGTVEFIAEARRNRKVLGGGMRQTGVLAAAGQVAIDQMIERLSEDHENAKRLAGGIANTPGLYVDPEQIKTNIVYFDLVSESLKPEEFLKRAARKGVKFLNTGPSRFRMVTHHGITTGDIDAALAVLGEVMKKYK
jgi:threonine aldolase